MEFLYDRAQKRYCASGNFCRTRLGLPNQFIFPIEVAKLAFDGNTNVFIETKLDLVNTDRHLDEFTAIQEAKVKAFS